MKRIGNLYDKICDLDNLMMADRIACRGKGYQRGIQEHILNRESNIKALHEMLARKEFKTSPYVTFEVYEPKKRIIYRLPYFPDRIVHHAVMNIMEPIWVPMFTADTYSCIKGRGVHSAAHRIKEALKDEAGTVYCLKLDVKKFYPSIDHQILKKLIRLKIKDQDLLNLLDGIIESAEGLPIGNYLSQFLANLYLTYFDHWLKECMKVKYYFRYCDDMIILSGSKPYLHQILADIRLYMESELKLEVKSNYQNFPVDQRGIDFLGYRFFRKHTLLRKSIKKNFARAVDSRKGKASIAAYCGWAKHADCKNLIKKLLHNETNEEVLRNGDTDRKQRIRWRKDSHQENPQQTNRSA